LFSHNQVFVRKHVVFTSDAESTDERTHPQRRKFDESANRTRLSSMEQLQPSLNTSETV
jgi:hypothetical protein